MNKPRFSDRAMIDWVEAHPNNAPRTSMDRLWRVTSYGNRECWGRGRTWRECMEQVLAGDGPEKPDR